MRIRLIHMIQGSRPRLESLCTPRTGNICSPSWRHGRSHMKNDCNMFTTPQTRVDCCAGLRIALLIYTQKDRYDWDNEG